MSRFARISKCKECPHNHTTNFAGASYSKCCLTHEDIKDLETIMESCKLQECVDSMCRSFIEKQEREKVIDEVIKIYEEKSSDKHEYPAWDTFNAFVEEIEKLRGEK